ncbi:choline dehydrogenase [Arthrobacter globiformis]|uniref:GMC family oxidoreductase n=1 Tax=Arthrobacter globiformis TaxID=1665 RepID=UPI0027869554|nr:FAD-dependent oxidoreductase [Arthrobacter globiformis]MDQ1058227.1 choline dehydrogenase [Arthrobacter globiformis]
MKDYDYDYIIVGAGSAGCAVAGRLSEDGYSVLLLEAGGSDDDDLIRTPLLFAGLFQGEKDWNYNSDPEPGLAGRRLFLPRGKVLGGSSSLNAMFYVRGARGDFDAWENEHGATGWSYDQVLPYFKRSEANTDLQDEFHGTDGPMGVTTKRWFSGYEQNYIDAAVQLGIERNDDINGAQQAGVGRLQVTGRDGQRCSSADAFLRPALARQNFVLVTNAYVQRILVESGRAVGVQFEHDGDVVTARAGREIVLSAGAYNTPKLLMLSGIGPADELRALGIDVVLDSPQVGRNLQDHPFTLTHYATDADNTLAVAGDPAAAEEWRTSRTGVLTSNAGEAAIFWRSDPALASPDFQMIFVPGWFWEHGFRSPNTLGMSIGLSYNGPSSRGAVTLRSADPAAPPRIVSNLLSQQHEVDAVLRALDFVSELTQQSPLRSILREQVNPGTSVTGALREQWVRADTQHMYHAAGSCRIGTPETGVVDAELRVHGIAGLRIADASIMPQITSGNTNAPSIMIGEKAADLLRGVTSAQDEAAASGCPYLAATSGAPA